MMIRTQRLYIRDFRTEDLNDLHRLLSDCEVMRYLEPPYSREKTESFLKKAGLCASPLIYAVEDSGGGFAGYVIYHPYERDSYEIGWVLCRENWGRGYARELTEALIRYASGKTNSLVIECVPEQAASIRVALHSGFRFEGQTEGCNVYRLFL